jgi:hypothetical protein
MTAFLNFHAFAAARGEGLHPKLRLLFERAAASPASDVTINLASAAGDTATLIVR